MSLLHFRISVKENSSTGEASASLTHFLDEETKHYGMQVLEFSENPLAARVAISYDKKHDLRVRLNLFSAETDTCWEMATD